MSTTTPTAAGSPTLDIPTVNQMIADAIKAALAADRASRRTASVAVPSTVDAMIGTFNSTARSDLEIEISAMTLLTKSDRDDLSASDKSKIQAYFIKGIPSKDLHFKALSSSSDMKDMMSITNLVSLMEKKQSLVGHLSSISTTNVFYVLNFDPISGALIPVASRSPVNLLKTLTLPTIDSVVASCAHHAMYGTSHSIENMKWTFDAIMNSCDQHLRRILSNKMLKYPNMRYGPVLFWFLMKQITTIDDTIVRAITTELVQLDISNTPGQSIAVIITRIRAAITWLNMAKMLPPDILAIVKKIMKTCTVPDFLLYVTSLLTNAELNAKVLTTDEFLGACETKYAALVLSGDYDLSTSGVSSFNISTHGATRNKHQSSRQDQGNRGDRRHKNPDWVRAEPTGSDPTTRDFEGRTYKWCGTCGRWLCGDRGHHTNEHIVGHLRNKKQTTPSANLATTAGSPAPSPIKEATDTDDEDEPTIQATGSATRDYLFFAGGL
jgi:hypothetical protein